MLSVNKYDSNYYGKIVIFFDLIKTNQQRENLLLN